MADDREAMDRAIRADLDLIRETLGAEDDHAAAFAIQTLANHIRDGLIVMTPHDLQLSMIRYAERALSVHEGERMEAVDMGNGTVGFRATGEPVPPAPAKH